VRGLRHELSSFARTLRSWVRIQLKAWMSVCDYSVCAVLCVGSSLAMGWSPVQQKDCRAIDRLLLLILLLLRYYYYRTGWCSGNTLDLNSGGPRFVPPAHHIASLVQWSVSQCLGKQSLFILWSEQKPLIHSMGEMSRSWTLSQVVHILTTTLIRFKI
jgi:hypothetical protein